MKRSYPSGAQKRKEKKAKEDEAKKCSHKLTSWIHKPAKAQDASTEFNDTYIDIPVCMNVTDYQDNGLLPNTSSVADVANSTSLGSKTATTFDADRQFTTLDCSLSYNDDLNEESLAERTDDLSDSAQSLRTDRPFPSDRGHYKSLQIPGDELKREIINYGPCKPKGPFPKDSHNRSFSVDYYTIKTNDSSLTLPRLWLCYSKVLDKVYCEHCWLFGDRTNPSFRSEWIEGINDWQGLSKKIKVHASTQYHSEASLSYDTWKNKKTIENLVNTELKEKINFWKKVLKRVIDVILMLASCNLAFRGHREEKVNEYDVHSRGNFLSVIELLAKYDGVLYSLLNSEHKGVNYLSPEIQNELIHLLSVQVKKGIIKDIQEGKFYSIILDTTQDISKQEQLSVIIRYVSIEYDNDGNLRELVVQESFLGFFHVTDQSAHGLETEILRILENSNISIENCRGQGYDGASVMSGIYSGLQKRIKNIQPKAPFVHCLAHNLNLILEDSVKSLVQMQTYYEILQKLYIFFSVSIKRWDILLEMMSADSQKYPVLKKLCGTRWSSRHDAIYVCRSGFRQIMKALIKISLISKDKETRSGADALYKHMNVFEFIIFLVMESKVLEMTNLVSKQLQSKNVDLLYATELLQTALENVKELRNNFDNVIKEAEVLAESWGIEIEFQKKRPKRTKSFFDELSSHEAITDAKHSFEVHVFNSHLDIIISQLNSRFEGVRVISHQFRCLFSVNLKNMRDDELFAASQDLITYYSEEISSDFTHQLLSLRNLIKKKLSDNMSINDLFKYLVKNHSSLLSNIPDVILAIKLYLTLPVTVASAERSFSKLKIIKNYLRSTMTQERLSALATLSIECERAKKLDINLLIEEFANKNVRRAQRFRSNM